MPSNLSQEEILQAIANLSRPQTGLEKANLRDLWAELDYRLRKDGSIIASLQAENERLKRDMELLEQVRDSLFKESSEDKKTCDHCIATMDKMYRQAMRSLWLARARKARDCVILYEYGMEISEDTLFCVGDADILKPKWEWAERKCREKAKEFE